MTVAPGKNDFHLDDGRSLAIEIGVPDGVYQFAREMAEMWFPAGMMEITEGRVTVVATPAHLADEAMRERVISLVADTPGRANVVADTVAARGIDPRRSRISLTIQRNDAASRRHGHPWRGAERMRALLAESSAIG